MCIIDKEITLYLLLFSIISVIHNNMEHYQSENISKSNSTSFENPSSIIHFKPSPLHNIASLNAFCEAKPSLTLTLMSFYVDRRHA